MTATANRIVLLGLLLIVALMPFHAFLSVWLGSLIGHQTLIQAWKEALIIAMSLSAILMVAQSPNLISRLKKPVNWLLAAFVLIALIVTVVTRPQLKAAAFGVKVDIEFLVVFVLAQLGTNEKLPKILAKVLIGASALVVGFGLLQVFALPKDFLTHFGYGPNTIQPYLSVDPVLNSFRILSTLGGPNQLGAFLILPASILTAMLVRHPKWWHVPFLLAIATVEWFTFSRSGLIGLVVSMLITTIISLPPKWRLVSLAASALMIVAASGLIAAKTIPNSKLQYYVLHGSLQKTGLKDSTDQHIESFGAALGEAEEHPLGNGLGTAGPASFHSNKPDITENFYLQIAIEAGLLGLVFFLGMTIALGLELWQTNKRSALAAPVLGALVGISVVNLFLHGWADSSTTLTFWAYAGAIIGART